MVLLCEDRNEPGALLRRYLGYINLTDENSAGSLQPYEGEDILTIIYDLQRAAVFADIGLEIRETGDGIYFWRARAPIPSKPHTIKQIMASYRYNLLNEAERKLAQSF